MWRKRDFISTISKFTVTEIEEKTYHEEPNKDKTYYEITLKSCIGSNYFFTYSFFVLLFHLVIFEYLKRRKSKNHWMKIIHLIIIVVS